MKTITLLVVALCINGVVTDESVAVIEGDNVTLHTNTEIQRDYVIIWRFGDQQDLIAKLNREANSLRINDDVLDGRFKGRLKMNSETGDLIITDITTQHTGDYKLSINGEKITTKTSIFSVSVEKMMEHGNNVNINDEESSGLSSGVVAGLCVFLLVLVFALAVAVFLYRRLSRSTGQRVNRDEETFED
ncbi:uncharacterized protein [Misgurnus anguillicaudatus]|uniref:uncharacterized protein isoform X2 n=1 Tax=Misgurnus anguillicaudatus TaxID=75329 RepID=UPI003CCFCB1F